MWHESKLSFGSGHYEHGSGDLGERMGDALRTAAAFEHARPRGATGGDGALSATAPFAKGLRPDPVARAQTSL